MMADIVLSALWAISALGLLYLVVLAARADFQSQRLNLLTVILAIWTAQFTIMEYINLTLLP